MENFRLIGRRIGRFIGSGVGSKTGVFVLFARYFNATVKFVGGLLDDLLHSGKRTAEPTICSNMDGTAEIHITSADVGTLTVEGITTGNAAATGLAIVYSTDKYVITSGIQKLALVEVKLSGATWAKYNCDEGVGEGTNAVLFDSSGNDRHASLSGATFPTIWTTDSSIPSVQNVRGYSVYSGVTYEDGTRIPALTTSKDILGNDLTYTGNAGYHMDAVERNCLEGDGTMYLAFANLPTYDAITVVEDGAEVSISLTGGNWTPTTGKKYNDVIFTNASVKVAQFTLEDYETATSPTSAVYSDLYENATATITSGTFPTNLSSCDGLSRMAEYGFNPAVVSDGADDYIDTNIKPTDDTDFVVYGRFNQITASFQTVGCRAGSGDRFYFAISSTGNWTIGWNSQVVQGISADTNYHKFRLYKGDFYIDDVIAASATGSLNSINLDIFLLALNDGGLSNSFSDFELIGASINNTEFFPQLNGTLKDQDGNVYTNQGTGDLGVKYIPASAIDTDKDVAGVDLRYKAGNSQSVANKYKAPEAQEFIVLDTENKFFDGSGNALTVDWDTFTDASYTETRRDSLNNVIDLKILK